MIEDIIWKIKLKTLSTKEQLEMEFLSIEAIRNIRAFILARNGEKQRHDQMQRMIYMWAKDRGDV
jgi:hypothetical protein